MTILSLRNMTKDFGGLRAVNSLSLDIESGQILALIGPNGAGKSTAFNCIAGVYTPTAGTITFEGENINGCKPWDLCKKGLARTFQIVKPFASKSVLYNVTVGSFARTGKRDAAEEKALEVLEFLQFSDKKDVRAGNLTIADRKRLEIARALATGPKLLLLDEVMAGLRPAEVDDMVEIIEKAAGQRYHHLCHRAHHAGHHGHVRPDRGDPVRQENRRGNAKGDRLRRKRDQGLSGRRLCRCLRSTISTCFTGTFRSSSIFP